MKLIYFGEIDPENVEGCLEVETPVLSCGYGVELDLNFEETSADPAALAKVNRFLEELETRLGEVMGVIAMDFDRGEDSETAVEFLGFHLEEFETGEIESIFGTTEVTRDIFLKSLEPQRVGFYPEDDEAFVIVDVSFRGEFTNYLMAVTYDSDLEFAGIDFES